MIEHNIITLEIIIKHHDQTCFYITCVFEEFSKKNFLSSHRKNRGNSVLIYIYICTCISLVFASHSICNSYSNMIFLTMMWSELLNISCCKVWRTVTSLLLHPCVHLPVQILHYIYIYVYFSTVVLCLWFVISTQDHRDHNNWLCYQFFFMFVSSSSENYVWHLLTVQVLDFPVKSGVLTEEIQQSISMMSRIIRKKL